MAQDPAWLEAAFARAQEMASVGCWELDLSNLEDVNANALRWSDGVYRIFGYRPGEVAASNALFFEAVHPDDRPAIAAAVQRALRDRTPYVIEHRIRRRDGAERWVLEHADVLCDAPGGRPRALFGTVQDVTDRALSERRLRDSEARVRELNSGLETRVRERTAELEAFSYMVSHDLRSPVRSMRAAADLLASRLGGEASAETREMLELLARGGRRADDIIRDMLTLSRLSHEALRIAPVDLDALVGELRKLHPQWAAAELRVRGSLGAVLGAESLLAQALANLIGNAVKFVPAGVKPVVELSAARKGSRVRISVSDNGVGLDAADQRRVFDPFVRVDPRYEGTGIGLAIVRRAVERLGGDVGVSSEKGRGATFWLELPAA